MQERNQALQQETLNAILQFLRIQPRSFQQAAMDIDSASTVDRQSPTSSVQANHLNQSTNAGGSTGPAGHGS
jgi:hypothetical protein